MDLNTIFLLLEAVLITGLSAYLWLGTQDREDITTMQWGGLLVLVLLLIGFAATLFFSPFAN